MRAPLLAMALLEVACTQAQYLGAAIPAPCEGGTGDAEGCLGWVMERDLLAAELAIYDDRELRAYVQEVVDRLAAVSSLGRDRTPRVVIADHDETYATAGRRIVIARTTIERLASEAELAGILAHELAHIEARHVMASVYGRSPEDSQEDRRDAELVADERAVALLERAGYAPAAMVTALASVLTDDGGSIEADEGDADHPPAALRIARVAKLAAGRGGIENRDDFLQHLEHMVVGRDPRLGHRLVVSAASAPDDADDVWVVPALGVAFDLGPDDDVTVADRTLVTTREHSRLVAYAVGAPWGAELASTLDTPRVLETALGRVTLGIVTVPAHGDDSPFTKLARSVRSTLPQPAAGTRVAILQRPHGALIIEVAGAELPAVTLRAATNVETALAVPARIQLVRATAAGTLGDLGTCGDRLLEHAAREVEAGDLVKCADRGTPPTVVAITNRPHEPAARRAMISFRLR